jgi:murein DD-endopeptidase MepM/ murein hydrolase activator NlpD
MTRNIKIISLVAAGTLLASPAFTYAESNQNKLNNIQSDLNSKQQELQGKQQEKTQIEQEIEALQKKLDDLNNEISKNENDLNAIQEEIQKTQKEIQEKKDRITYLQEQIAKRQEVIKERLQAVQEQPRTNLITEVVVNAKNLAELLENLYSVNLILNSDNDILKEQARDKQAVEKEKEAVEAKENDLKKYEQTLNQKKQELEAQKQEAQAVSQELHAKLAQTNSEIESVEEATAILEAQKQAVQKAIEEEERAKTVAAKQEAPKPSSSSAESSNGSVITPPAANNGGFIKPAAGYYSSGFGMRDGHMHPGLDIAATGNVPVVAAADGVVIRSYLSSSYGNVVFISHRINGKTYTTVYAHMQNRLVSEGQTVKQGQQLGLMGSTGESTGQHLHFELHVGEWNMAKSNAVDPRPYLP